MEPSIDKVLEAIISDAIQRQLPCVTLRTDTHLDDVRRVIRVYMRQHPEVFWFSHQYRLDEAIHTLYFKYNFTPQKKDFYVGEIDKAVEHLFQPDKLKHLSDLEKVAYVYKWIVNNTTYNEYSSFNQTIYSVLINRNSVCTGYAKTAQYLLEMIGVHSELVFGKFHADKSDGGRHGWNIVKIDGDWYHIDFCLADPALKHLLNSDESPIEHDGLLWNYFCKPTEYIRTNRSIEFVDLYPECVKSLDKLFTIKLAKAQEQTIVCKSDSGTSAKVYLDSFDKDCVIKKTRNNTYLIDNEVKMLQCLKGCEHIVQLKGRTNDGIVLEQLTPWSELLNSHYYHPNEAQLKDILIQLAEGLIECRDNGITYSDIHYNNVFVSKDGTYKWGDFGIAYQSTTDGHLPHQLFGADGMALGSRWFISPETYRDGVFTESSAIYSLAMLAYFVMNDMRPPFWGYGDTEKSLNNYLNFSSQLPTPSHSFKDLWDFLNLTSLNFDRSNRFQDLKSFKEAICLNCLKGDVSDILLSLKRQQLKAKLLQKNNIKININGDSVDSPSNAIHIPKGKLAGGTSLCGEMPKMALEDNLDSDDFATTSIPSFGLDKCSDGLTYDTDSFARTCGVCPILSTSNHNEHHGCKGKLDSSIAHRHEDKDTSSYSPSKTKARPQGDCHAEKPSIVIGAMIGGVFNAIGGLFTGFAAGVSKPDNQQNIQSEINACVYAPAEVRLQKTFIIRVYMYKPEDQNAVESKVKDIDPKAVKKEYKPLDIPVKNGHRLTVQLDLSDGVECKNTTKTVIWRGHYTDCSFMAKLTDASQESVEGTAYIFVNDIPAGEMLFTIDVVEAKPRELYTRVESHRFSKIFISYAHQDETQVRGIAEGCRMLGKDYFFDRHSLQAGDIFKKKILDYIDKADLFVLCWSKNAAESEWVQIEREHALRLIREGKSSLSIYPLCLRPEAPLPLDMSDTYNFGVL